MATPPDDASSGAGDSSRTRTYISVIVLEAVIIAVLWALGRMYR